MKRYISKIMTVFVLIAMLPLQAWAAEDGGVRLEAERSNTNVGVVKVTAVVPEAAGEKLSSLQLGLMLTDRDGTVAGPEVLEQVENVSFEWDARVRQKTKITEQRYQQGVLHLYLAGDYIEGDPLFQADGELTLGKLNVELKEGTSNIYVSVAPGSLKKVQGSRSVPVQDEAHENLPQPVLLITDSNGSSNGSGTPGGSDGSDSTDGTAGPGADKSTLKQMLEIAAGYEEADYTPDSYALLKQAVKDAQAVLEDENAGQEEVDRAAEALMNAIGGLVLLPKTSIEDGSSQGTFNTGTDSGQSTSQNAGWFSGQNRSAATGDTALFSVWIIAALGAAVSAGVMYRSGRKH